MEKERKAERVLERERVREREKKKRERERERERERVYNCLSDPPY